MKIARCIMILLLLSCAGDCARRGQNGTDAGDPSMIIPGDLTISPGEVGVDVTAGGARVGKMFTARTSGGYDVSSFSMWTVDDPTLGDFSGSTLSVHTEHGGTTRVHASFQGKSASAVVHVKIHAAISDGCAGCPSFPPDGKVQCPGDDRRPAILYPPDGTLLPPNLNVIEPQFHGGVGNTLFEIDLYNDLTDVRILSRCQQISDARGLQTGACGYELPQGVWDLLSKTNLEGDALYLAVRGTDDAGTCISPSGTRAILFAKQDLTGGIYYWQSVVNGGAPGRTGGIFRYDFGKRGKAPEAYLTPGDSNTCVGCHFLSRDGQKMTYGADDADADDEYGDVMSLLIDVGSKHVPNPGGQAPGFQTFSPDHSMILASDGHGFNQPPAFILLDGSTGQKANPAKVMTGKRGTQPDWSADGRNIVYVQPAMFFGGGFLGGGDDHHFIGGSLYTISYDPGNKTFGEPTALLTSGGENNYYPGFSPDGTFLIYNTVPKQGTMLLQDSFYNVNARVMLLSVKPGAQPLDLPALNDTSALTNSWPRWSPFISSYKGRRLAWVTFSSTRDYGARVRNSIQVDTGKGQGDQVNCYPPDSPENQTGGEDLPPNCHHPQLWMAAIDLTVAQQNIDVGSGDPSYPAFWLPLQDVKSHNHIAQWVTTIVNQPPPDGGCIPIGGTCSAASSNCCCGVCLGNVCALP